MAIKYTSGDDEFDSFTLDYLRRLEGGDGNAIKFRELAAADDARALAAISSLKLQELEAVRKENEEVKNRVATVSTSESGKDQARQAEIYRQYGNIGTATANARVEEDARRRLAEYLGTISRAKYASDFGSKSVYVRSVSDDDYHATNDRSEGNYMTGEEIAVYNYIYATEGAEKAEAFLNTLTDYLNQREGQAKAEGVKGNYLGQLGVKAEAGFDQFASGIGSLFNDGQMRTPSAIQYASAAVDEDLADVDLKWYNFAEGQWKDQKIFGRSLGQLGGDTVQTTANMLPSIAASTAVGIVNPTAGAWVGTTLMGSSAAGNAYQDMLNQGYSKEQAASYGVLVGVSEATLEKVLGGITPLGGGNLTKSVTSNLSKVDNVLAQFATSTGGKVLLNASSEAVEEGLQSILEPYFRAAVTGEEFAVDLETALYDALMGFVTGGVFEGAPAVTTAAAGKMSDSISAKKNDRVEAAINVPWKAATVAGAEVQGEVGKNALANQTPDKGLSDESRGNEMRTEVQAAAAAIVRNDRTVETGATKTDNATLKAASKKYGAQAATMENTYQEGQDVERFDREYKLAYDMGKEGASYELLESGGAFAYLTAEQKNTAYQSGAAAAENMGIVAGAVKSLGITGEHAGALTQSFNANQITAKDYAMGLQEAYEAGKTGIPLAQAGSHAAKLTDAQRQIAYKQGQKTHGKQVAKQQAQARKNRSAGGADTSKGKVHFEGDRAKLNKVQRASMDAMEVLAKALGVQIHVFESKVDEHGNHVGANGWYDPSDGSIHIDLYAGNSGKGTMLFTVAHELTHFIKQWSPAKFRVLANFLTKQYTAKGQSISELVETQQDKAARNGRELSREEAYEEVVADSMESMLADGSVIEMMAELKQQDQGLWQKIRDWFKDLAGKLRAVVDAYKGVQSDSVEGRLVADMKDMIGTLQALYMDALVDASENFDAGVQKITTEDSGGVRYMGRDQNGNVVVDEEVDAQNVRKTLTAIYNGNYKSDNNYFPVLKNTPEVYMHYCHLDADRSFVMAKKKAYKAMQQKNKNQHALGVDGLMYVIENLGTPDYIVYQNVGEYAGNYAAIIISEEKEIFAAVQLGEYKDAQYAPNGEKGYYNTLITAFYPNEGYIDDKILIPENDVVYDKNEDPLQVASGVTPSDRAEGSSRNSIRNPNEVVNKKFSDRDAAYMDAVKRGDMETAQRMVDEAAKAAGYTVKAYHGTSNNFWEFRKGHKRTRGSLNFGDGFYFAPSRSYAENYTNTGRVIEGYLKLNNPYTIYGTRVDSSDYARISTETGADVTIENITEVLKVHGYDGIIARSYNGTTNPVNQYVIFDSNQVKSADPVTYDDNGNVIPLSERFNENRSDIRYSQRDVGRQEAVTQALEKENAKLREDVSELRELVSLQRQVTNGTKFTKTSVEAAAISLKQSANAKGDTKGFAKLLNGLYEYIASTKELTWEGVKEQAQAAVDWLWEHIDRKGKPTEYAQDILKQLHGARVRLDESQMAEAEYRFGSYNEFRKRLMGSITLAKDASTSLDSLWAEFSELYPDVFDGEITAADMPGALADIIERLRTPEATTLDYARDREMMEQDLLRQVYDSYWRVSTLYTPADVGARRINKLKMEHYQRMDKLKQQHRETLDQMKQAHQARLEQVRKEHRAKLEEKTEQITKKYQEARKKNVEGRRKTEMRGKIRKVIRDLNKLLAHGTKERNVKEGMKDLVANTIASAEVLFIDTYTTEDMIRNGVGVELTDEESKLLNQCIDILAQLDNAPAVVDEQGMSDWYQTERKLRDRLSGLEKQLEGVFQRERKRLDGTTVSSILGNLSDAYAGLKDAEQDYLRDAYDENVFEHLQNIRDGFGVTRAVDMRLDQLEALHKAYTMVLTTVRNANKSFAANLKGSRKELAQAVTGELAQAGRKQKGWTKGQIKRARRSWNNEKPVYAFERLGSGTMKTLYGNLRDGEDTWMVDMDEAREFYLKAAKDHGFNGWDFKQRHSFTSSTGLEFDLDLQQIMSIYAYSRREQALDHLMKGGFVFDKNTEMVVDEGGIRKTYIVDNATAYNLSIETFNEIISKLTLQQKAFVDTMQAYLSDTMGDKGNEISMKLYGVKLFNEKFYFPLHSSGAYLDKAKVQELQKQQGQVSIKNSGFTNATTPKASNPVVLSGFMDVWANHVNDMSMYHAFVLPLEDFNKVYRYSTPHIEGEQSGSVNQAIINAHGSAATDYIDRFVRDLNGGVVADPRESDYKAWISKFKKASVMASASVVIQQPTAIVRALAYIDPKYFGVATIGRGIGRALGNKVTGNHTRLYDELKKYAPVAAVKQMGRFDTDMGRGAVDYLTAKEFDGVKEKFRAIFKEKGYFGKQMDEVMGFAAARADEITWLQIWEAVKKEVAAKQGLKFGSEEHLQTAGKRFTEVITKTQVYDSVFARSANMRSKGAFMSMATSFMAEPTTTANMLTDAIRKAKKGDVKFFLRAGTSVAGAIIFNNILRSFVYAARDDDEDETFIEKYLQALAGGMLDDINPMSYLPFWRDVWSLAQGYDVERADMSVIATAIDAATSLGKALMEDTSEMTEEQLAKHNEKLADAGWKFVDGLSSLVGLPERNLRRDIMGAANFFDTVKADGSRETTSGSLKDKVWEDFISSVPGVNIVVDADSRTDNLYDAIVAGDTAYVDRLKSGYKSNDAYTSAVRKGLRENDVRIKAAAVARMNGELESYMNIAKEIIAEGHFTQDDVVVAINAVINELTESKSSASMPKSKGLFDANAFAVAVTQDDADMANVVREDIIRTAQLNGKTEEEAQKSFISSAISACKELYGEGDLTEDQAVNALVEFCGKDEVEARGSVSYWEYSMEYPDAGISAQWFETYYRKVDGSDISIEVYVEYRNRKSGYTKRTDVLKVIDRMDLTKAQKDTLYRAEGYAESTLDEAPWRR